MGVFLIGFGVGVFGGMLMAPKPGRYYREVLGERASESLAPLMDKTAGLRGSVAGAVGKGRDVVAQQIERITCSTPAEVYQR